MQVGRSHPSKNEPPVQNQANCAENELDVLYMLRVSIVRMQAEAQLVPKRVCDLPPRICAYPRDVTAWPGSATPAATNAAMLSVVPPATVHESGRP